LLNDAMLVSVKKRRGTGVGGAVRLVAERCFNLSDIVVVDLKDGGGRFSWMRKSVRGATLTPDHSQI
jgi:hypothetical protein